MQGPRHECVGVHFAFLIRLLWGMSWDMHELPIAIPDPDVVLALEPEELGATILFLLRARGGSFHPHNCMMEVLSGGDRSRGVPNYSKDRCSEITIAISEAFAWLKAQGLVVPKPGDTGGWMILSRRACRFESEEDVQQFRMARNMNRDLLHPAIAEKVWLAFVRGDFAEAVFTAMRAVEVCVRWRYPCATSGGWLRNRLERS